MRSLTLNYYAKIKEYSRRQHIRYKRFVEAKGLTCQECGGMGGEHEDILQWFDGPWVDCGWCQGTGKVTPWLRGQWLKYKREKKNEKSL